jgi:hypothetical protein
VTDNGVLGRTFGPKVERAEGQGKVHYEDLHNLYPASHRKGNGINESCSGWGEMRSSYKMLIENF